MSEKGTCDICQSYGKGKRYTFYYARYLGTSGTVIDLKRGYSSWENNYTILGKDSAFFCKKCYYHEMWKRHFWGRKIHGGIPKHKDMDRLSQDAIPVIVSLITFAVSAFVLFGAFFWDWHRNGFVVLLIIPCAVAAIASIVWTLTAFSEFGSWLAISVKAKESPNSTDSRYFTPKNCKKLKSTLKIRSRYPWA